MTVKTITIRTVIVNIAKCKKLGVSPSGFVMCSLMEHFISKHQLMTNEDLKVVSEKHGIDNVKDLFFDLVHKGICEFKKSGDKKTVHLTGKWNDLPIDFEDKFEWLWADYGRIGDKQPAKRMLKKYLEAGNSWDDLVHKYWSSYKVFLANNKTTQMHLSSFLNPEEEKFKREFTANAHFGKNEKDNVLKSNKRNVFDSIG